MRGSIQGRGKRRKRSEGVGEACKSVPLSRPEAAADFHQLLLGLSEKGLTGMLRHT